MDNNEMNGRDNKRKSNRAIWIILGVFILIGIVAFIAMRPTYNSFAIYEGSNNSSTTSEKEDTQQNCREIQIPYEEQEEYLKTEYYTETIPYTNKECENKELAYSITNFVMNNNACNKEEYICKKTVLGICTEKQYYCVDKSISCSLNLNNLDNEQRGSWQISFNYIAEGTSNIVKTENVGELLYPQTSSIFNSAVNIQSVGIEGDANKDLTCTYAPTYVPTKQICRDVTKYKEIQRERQVTAYKPVTKYRTETKCN